MEVSLLTAFLGGFLALLSPCGALLLPAFFASTVTTRLGLAVHGGIFYTGLALTLVPIGLGLGVLGELFTTGRGVLIAVTSIVLVVLGLVQAAGFGFDLTRILPGASRLQQRASARSGFLRTFLLGAASGVAGMCAGPILGAVLTLAMAQGDTLSAGLLLAVYSAGMVVPLMALAAVWGRLGPRGRKLLRGRGFTVFGRELHSTSVITGLLIAGVGLLFWFTNGLVSMPSLLPTSAQSWLQGQTALLAHPLIDVGVILLLAATALTAWTLGRRRRHTRAPLPQPATAQDSRSEGRTTSTEPTIQGSNPDAD